MGPAGLAPIVTGNPNKLKQGTNDSEDEGQLGSEACLPETHSGTNEPRSEKTGLRGFRPGLTQTRLYNHTGWLEACNFGFRYSRGIVLSV